MRNGLSNRASRLGRASRAIIEPIERRLLLSGGSIGGSIQINNGTAAGTWTVYLDNNNNGVLDQGEPTQTVTPAAGSASVPYQFNSLAASNYIVRVIAPGGYRQLYPLSSYGIHISLSANQTAGNENFQFDAPSTTVSGTVGVTGGEWAVGWTAYLDANNDSKLDNGEASVTVGTDGIYQFNNVEPGAYIVRIIAPAGYQQVTPSNNYGQHITVSANQNITGENFVFTNTMAGSISGTVTASSGAATGGWTVYLDLNNNGVQDSSDPSTTVSYNGFYTFSGMAPGNYIVRVVAPAGYTQITPGNNFGQHVTLAAEQNLTGANFTFKSPNNNASIAGEVFNDANDDGTRENGETGLAGWTVYLDLNNSGSFVTGDPTTTTGSSGVYQFSGLAAGTYIVRVERPSGFSQTSPSNNYGQHVTLVAGQQVGQYDFGEKQIS